MRTYVSRLPVRRRPQHSSSLPMLSRLVRGRRSMVWLAMVLAACSADRLTAPTLKPSSGAAYILYPTQTGPNLLIVELMADPTGVPANSVLDNAGEWIKLYNPGPTAVTLTNFKIQSSSGT